ncbi:MAG: Uma2 family endonuclease [Pyrinomonadaceae bacterium]|nr:Uma2 family endonuclease [Pyrinomonadaceae bacterium]
MTVPQEKLLISVEDYLESEKHSNVRYEYLDGQVFAMAGESKRHNRIAGKLVQLFGNHLENTNYDVYFESVKMKTSATKYYYPDVVVTCDENDEDDYNIENAVLVIEVLSPSTERIDRAEKLIAYKKMPSLRECILTYENRVFVQIHRKIDAETWAVENYYDLESMIKLDSIDYEISISEVYRNIVFPPVEEDLS